MATFPTIAASEIDAESPITTGLMNKYKERDQGLFDWIGKDYTLSDNHDHDGVNSKAIDYSDITGAPSGALVTSNASGQDFSSGSGVISTSSTLAVTTNTSFANGIWKVREYHITLGLNFTSEWWWSFNRSTLALTIVKMSSLTTQASLSADQIYTITLTSSLQTVRPANPGSALQIMQASFSSNSLVFATTQNAAFGTWAEEVVSMIGSG